MGRKSSTVFAMVVNYICLLLGMAAIIVSTVSPAWWVLKLTSEEIQRGLLMYCRKDYNEDTTRCHARKNLMQFKHGDDDPNGDHRDIILLCFFIANFINMLTAFVYCFLCTMKKKNWRMLTGFVAFLVTASAIIIIGALCYYEVQFRKVLWKVDRKDSWSYILGWIGAGFLLLAVILSFFLIFLNPRNNKEKIIITQKNFKNSSIRRKQNSSVVRVQNLPESQRQKPEEIHSSTISNLSSEISLNKRLQNIVEQASKDNKGYENDGPLETILVKKGRPFKIVTSSSA